MVTIRDVAKRASVSVSTASRILSNSTTEKFAEATQAKVLRASIELGYRPHFAARALASGKTNIIAAVFPRIYDTPFTALASLQILAGIEDYCSENGYHLLLNSPKVIDGTVTDNFTDLLAGGYLDGLIVDGNFSIDPIMTALDGCNVPHVMLGYYPHPYYLRSDNMLGGKMLAQHLIDLGHRRIGIIALPDGASTTAEHRLNGIRAVCEQYGIVYETLPRADGTFSFDSGAAAAGMLLTSYPDLTALIALNDRMAMGAVHQLHQMGYVVPQQISVVGYDDLPQTHDFDPPLTTINQQLSQWGAIAMTMLLKLVDGGEPEPVIVPPHLIVRASTAPVAA